MAWVTPRSSDDSSATPTRMSYYLRSPTSTVYTKTFTINDQLPSGGIFRVSCTGNVGCPTAVWVVGTVLEVRLLNAFTLDRVQDVDTTTSGNNGAGGGTTPNQNYILLGTLTQQGANAASRTVVFQPAVPVFCNAINSSLWSIQFVSAISNVVVTTAGWIGAYSFQINVRGQGDVEFVDL